MNTWKDKALFTPGPLTTSRSVKQAMLRDLGSRDVEFIHLVAEIRRRLVEISQASPENYTAVLMQGSGTFGIESVISSVVPPDGKILILVNGAYGERIEKIARIHKIASIIQWCPENQIPNLQQLDDTLANNPDINLVAVVHCETTTGIVNPIDHIGNLVSRHHRAYMVDAMSSFGAYDIQVEKNRIDYLVSSSNKCIEGIPGFSFVIARKKSLQATCGLARTLSLDLYHQWESLEKDGQFRFTPPVQAMLAFRQALVELEEEGGPVARGQRYRDNYNVTLQAMEEMGFRAYVDPDNRGYTITSFYYPDHPNFSFGPFYQKLSDKGCVIYPGKLSHADCFRVGHIGRLDQSDVFFLLAAIRETLKEMGIIIPMSAE